MRPRLSKPVWFHPTFGGDCSMATTRGRSGRAYQPSSGAGSRLVSVAALHHGCTTSVGQEGSSKGSFGQAHMQACSHGPTWTFPMTLALLSAPWHWLCCTISFMVRPENWTWPQGVAATSPDQEVSDGTARPVDGSADRGCGRRGELRDSVAQSHCYGSDTGRVGQSGLP